MFNGVELLQGWLVVNDAGAEAGIAGSRFTWKMWESDDIKSDRERLALDLMTSLDARVNAVVVDGALSILEVFDAAKLVSLQCGSISGEDIKLLLPEGELWCGPMQTGPGNFLKYASYQGIWDEFRSPPSISIHESY